MDVLHVPRVEHPDYPGCKRLRIVSKDDMISAFCERSSDWCDRQFTPCKAFAKGPRFINMVMTFVLHPLSHYNSITEPRAQFLLSLLEHLIVDFPSHFILSIIDVFKDMATREKLIFPSAITRILCHFSVIFPSSAHYSVMCAINTATVKGSKVQFRSRQSDSAAPPSRSAPSTSAPSSSTSDVSLGDIMVQLQRMDARFDTLSTELHPMNVHFGRIAWRQVIMAGFAPEASHPPPSVDSDFKDEDEDDDDGDDDDGDDDDASDDDDGDASSTDEMST